MSKLAVVQPGGESEHGEMAEKRVWVTASFFRPRESTRSGQFWHLCRALVFAVWKNGAVLWK
jgi:hypothetical protein